MTTTIPAAGQLAFTNETLPTLGEALRVCDRVRGGRYAFQLNGEAFTCKRVRSGLVSDFRRA
jgi:hypothetical protein